MKSQLFPTVTLSHEALPARLRASDPALETVHIQGCKESLALLERLPERGLAIVGTRYPQARSLALVEDCVQSLSGKEVVIVSGLARGIDAAAHWAALRAGVPTIAVLGGSLDCLYPRENEPLAEAILENGGLLVSESPPGTVPQAHYFLKRNRIIAFWSHAVWVVEAPYRSGALNTAKWAREYQRTCFATPGFPGDPSLLGNQTLLDEGGAHPYWGPHSLGTEWIPFSSLFSARLKKRKSQQKGEISAHSSLLSALDHEIHSRTKLYGGVTVHALLDWCLKQDCTPQHFFETLHSGLTAKRFRSENGVLLSIEK